MQDIITDLDDPATGSKLDVKQKHKKIFYKDKRRQKFGHWGIGSNWDVTKNWDIY